jgi:outer membrane protein assembly factor BamA
MLQYNLDFRAYKQLTRRSLLAWRVATAYSAGDRETYYAFGGINQLRGWDYRDFFGSRIAYSNLEFRFPLFDQLSFPFGGGIGPIRGFLFLDVGAAWFEDDLFWDPELRIIRTDQQTGQPIGFQFWDSENNRLQDGRASYGFGFQFFFIGGLQFNWSWAKRLEYTRYVWDSEVENLVPTEADTGDTRMDFYIVFDW